jgi:hypothetical protein
MQLIDALRSAYVFVPAAQRCRPPQGGVEGLGVPSSAARLARANDPQAERNSVLETLGLSDGTACLARGGD